MGRTIADIFRINYLSPLPSHTLGRVPILAGVEMSPSPLSTEIDPLTQEGFQPFHRFYFKTAVTYFQLKRFLKDKGTGPATLPKGDPSEFPVLLAESRSPIHGDRPQELPFEKAKWENLRIALGSLDKVVLEEGAEFSFWRQVGKPTEDRGYRMGREIRWGCMVPAVGGGLCQLSGALFECALQAGAKVTESHSHSHRLPGAPYHPERDATIFWNYVDLRFQSRSPLLIQPTLTQDELIIRFFGKQPRSFPGSAPIPSEAHELHDCLVCGLERCSFHAETQKATGNAGFLFDPGTGTPNSTKKLKAAFLSLADRILGRTFNGLGLPVGKAAILRSRTLGALVRILYPFQKAHAMVSQDLAPHLVDWLRTRGIPYDLKLEHLPIRVLQSRLDLLAKVHPGDNRLGEYRAPQGLPEKEEACVLGASRIWTDHPALKELFPSAELQPDLQVPPRMDRKGVPKDLLLFPGPCYAREGILELLKACQGTGFQVVCPHPTAKDHPFIQYVERVKLPWERIAAYVHPCVFDRPNALLRQAVAEKVPILGTLGVPFRGKGFLECSLGDVEDLAGKLERLKEQRKGGTDADH